MRVKLDYFYLAFACGVVIKDILAKDYYKLLGVSKDATDREIKRAFRKLAVKYHPDKNKSPDAESIFRDIAEAHEVLSDEKKRRIYDQHGEAGLKNEAGFDGSAFHFNFDDFFQGFNFDFGSQFHGRSNKKQKNRKNNKHSGGGFFNFGSLFDDDDDDDDDADDGFGNGDSFFRITVWIW